ncbi:hypothetical protein BpHYR1_022976 [Brachionus plicatilis]|uniref:Uncharacterized protein n=1 Tax=Brachionus plicatilis TaxID=10195 RepID=A0A3M7RBC2_BRAPC|nr:hypothetical protein BpHYR1_022976 [Brachionus plicatilis]
MRKELKNRNLDTNDLLIFDNENEPTLAEEEKSSSRTETNMETEESLKKTSPFKIYFDSVLKKLLNKIEKSNLESLEENIFHDPKLFGLIADQLYLLYIKMKNLLSNSEEKWADKKPKRKGKKQFHYEIDPIKEKGFYYQKTDIFKLIYNDLFEFDFSNLKKTTSQFEIVSSFIDESSKSTNNLEPMEIENQDQDVDIISK